MSQFANISSAGAYPPPLTRDDEYSLSVDLYENKNLDAAKKLILANMRFVSYIAGEYRGYGMDHSDLVQNGSIGLMKAIKKFNPYKKVRLATFAVYSIRAEIHEFIIKNWNIVKLATTKAQRKLFFKMAKLTSNNGASISEDAIRSISNELSVSPDSVKEMEYRLLSKQSSEDSLATIEDKSKTPEDIHLIDSAKAYQHKQINSFLGSLTFRERDIVESRYLSEPKTTLSELAKRYAMSAEGIRKIEKKAFEKFKSKNLALDYF